MLKKISLIFLLISFPVTAQEYIRGADLSSVPQIEDLGGKYKLNGEVKDVLDIFKQSGANYIRLRLWHTPQTQYNGLTRTIAYAKRIKEKGLKFLLNFHYSDIWADPEHQTKPEAWKNLTFDQLKDSVYEYTKRVMNLLAAQNALPDMVQIGNEISGGMLWPDGKLYNVPDFNGQKIKFGQLLKEGIRAVRDAAGSNSIKIMIHIPILNGNSGNVTYFYDLIAAQNVEYDIIGLSYYPWWHGNLTELKSTLNTVASRYNKDIVIVETAYPWSTGYQNDNTTNLVGPGTTLIPDYPATPAGQKNFLLKLLEIIKETNNNKGIGFFYWEPADISVSGRGSVWENVATFGFTNSNREAEALPSLDAFMDLSNSISESYYNIPGQFFLHQNYPNPFNPETTINYNIPVESDVSIIIYDLIGREIVRLVDEVKSPGSYTVRFSAIDSGLSSGLYFYRLKAGNYSSVRKMIYLK